SAVVKRLQERERLLVLDNLVALAGDAEHTVAATHRGDDSLSRNHEVSVIDNVLEVIGLVRRHGVLDGNGHLADIPISKASETKHLVRVGNLLGEDGTETVPRGLAVRSKEVNPTSVSDCSNHEKLLRKKRTDKSSLVDESQDVKTVSHVGQVSLPLTTLATLDGTPTRLDALGRAVSRVAALALEAAIDSGLGGGLEEQVHRTILTHRLRTRKGVSLCETPPGGWLTRQPTEWGRRSL